MDHREFRERYQYDSETDLLGQGGFGRVFRARDLLLDRWVALKIFSRDVPRQYDLISEIRRAIDLNHANICRYYGAEVLRGVNALGETQEIQVGVMEFIEGGTIDAFLKSYPQYRKKLLADVLRGLSYLHRHQPPIIHRDLKPSNVLVGFEDGAPAAKITDFGISKSAAGSGASVSRAGLGTYAYMAPEQLNPARYGVNGKIQCNLDLWSYGAMMIELLTGLVPFGAGEHEASTGQIMESIILGVSPQLLNGFDEPYRSVLRLCMVQDAGKRAQSAAELLSLFDVQEEKAGLKSIPEARPQSVPEAVPAPPFPLPPPPPPVPALPAPNPPSKRRHLWVWFLGPLAIVLVVALVVASLKPSPAPAPPTVDDTPHGLDLQAREAVGRQDYDNAAALYSRSCDAGIADACEGLADMYGSGTGVARDAHKYAALYEKACDLGEMQLCNTLGDEYANGTGVTKDSRMGVSFYRTACNDGISDACNNLGLDYDNGTGVSQDYARAVAFYTKSCDAGNALGCNNLGWEYEYGQGVAEDEAHALALFTKACDASNANGCSSVGQVYRYGWGVTADADKAKEYFTKGCNMANQWGCDRLKEME